MIVSIMQPAYIPWLGYFDRIYKSDIHVILDDVAMDKNSKTKYLNRNKIRTPTSWSWLTIPLEKVSRSNEKVINNLQIAPDIAWPEKHWKTIKSNYSRSPYFLKHYFYFENLYHRDFLHLNPMLFEITQYLLNELGIKTEILISSDLSPEKKKADLILELCIKVGAKTYLSGPFGRDYLDERVFEEAGIKIKYHDYVHPVYNQTFNGFEPYMSVIDLLFNHGEKSLDILTS